MPRTVLGWRCRWGSGRSLPTSYTSPQAANKPLIVFPIHTDRGRHCLSGFTPRLSHGPWFTPFKKYGLFKQFCSFPTDTAWPGSRKMGPECNFLCPNSRLWFVVVLAFCIGFVKAQKMVQIQ